MKLITKDTDYAIAAVTYLARRPRETCSVAEMAAGLKISHSFLRKVMQTLSRNGIVESRKGMGGGFVFTRDPDTITIRNMIEIFQGNVRLNDCIVRYHICPRQDKCILRAKLLAIQKKLLDELMNLTMSSLLDEPDAASTGAEPRHVRGRRKWKHS